ncbi:uncharacterized protein EI90DRAFT_3122862 [Cantharellus anzutake]|uniref:uncharacterized protein n=1 Tax=Cantharellus anzutake TaxID=1750568 RepID=UPI0019069C3C|nr:uncharacterized protein EI90DRAFT_3122862 [Cantharellus anzutake]KAF8332376.1 hypothetical protein EI90DRAFT_3122862 [Cantharellus anzutake]
MYNQGPPRGATGRPGSGYYPHASHQNVYPITYQESFTAANTPYVTGYSNPFNPYASNQSQSQVSLHSASNAGIVNACSSGQIRSQAPAPAFAYFQPPLKAHGARAGPHRCSRAGCSYSSHSKKDVVNHMMDRHFIYPPGWDEKKRKREEEGPDGDAASCKFVQIYRMKLDTPEAIENWVAERKKRWPSTQRIAEKAQMAKDAKARGELFMGKELGSVRTSFSNSGTVHGSNHPRSESGRGRARVPGRARGRGRGRVHFGSRVTPHQRDLDSEEAEPSVSRFKDPVDNGWGTRGQRVQSSLSIKPAREQFANQVDNEDSNSDMDPILDAVSSRPPLDAEAIEPVKISHLSEAAMMVEEAIGFDENPKHSDHRVTPFISSPPVTDISISLQPEHNPPVTPVTYSQPNKNTKKRRVIQPPKPRSNPFALTRPSRPPLLRSLLNHDVQITISNVSQAIRFLVANDFLRGVELKPGQAEEEQRSRSKVVVLDKRDSGSAQVDTPET